MSLDFKNSELEGAENTPKKIRSKYRLRLMNRLVERQETVSELAKLVGLRMPHASAEIKRMRREKLVSSDLEMGSRGAKIRLTEKGRKLLQMDEWFKIEKAFPLPHEKGKYCILYREGVDILFAFLQQPEEPLILVPDKLPDSRGNKGVSWSWAKLNEDGLTWFDLDKRIISDEGPILIDPQNIESYSISQSFKWIKKQDGTEIINRVTPEWLESTDDKEGLYELLNERENDQKEKESMLDNIEKQRKEENIIKEDLERIIKEKQLINDKLEELED